MNVQNLKFKASRGMLALFIFNVILIVLAGFIGILIAEESEDYEKVLCFLFCIYPFVTIAGLALHQFLASKKYFQDVAEACGVDNIRSHIQYGTHAAYKDFSTGRVKICLTDAFIYVRNEYIVDYQQIVLMKSFYSRGRYSRGIHINLYMLDGKMVGLYRGLNDKNVEVIMRYCLQRNPKIRTTWSAEDYKDYKENAKNYKNGQAQLPRLKVTPLYAPIDTNEASEYSQPLPMNDYGNTKIPYESTQKGIQESKYNEMKRIGWCLITVFGLTILITIIVMIVTYINGELDVINVMPISLGVVSMAAPFLISGSIMIIYAKKKIAKVMNE